MAGKNIKGITIEIGANTSKLGDAIKDSEKKITSLQFELKSVEKLLQFDPTNTELLAQKQAILTSEVEETTKKLDILKEAEKQVVEQFEKGEIGEEQLRAFQREIIKTVGNLDGMKEKLSSTEKAINELADGTSDANKHTKDYEESVEEAKEGLTNFKDVATDTFEVIKYGAEVLTAAGGAVAAFGAYTINTADEAKGAINDFMASTGEAVEKTEEYHQIMENIYNGNYGESFEDIAAAMAEVKQQARVLEGAGLEEMTTKALILRDTFDFEVNESIRAADALMENLGIDGEYAFNLIAQAAQNGANKNGDLLDVINEYSIHYAQLGYSADEMFNTLVNGSNAGIFSVDKLGDAMKEFGIRVKDGSDSSREAFEYLGHDADELFKIFSEGGDEAAEMTRMLIDELSSMPEGLEKNTAGVALFGTMWEDLGAEAISTLGDVSGKLDMTVDTLDQLNSIKYDTFGESISGVGRILQTEFVMPIGEQALPTFIEFATTLSEGAKVADGDMRALASCFGEALEQLMVGIGELIPDIASMASELILGLTDGLISSAPQIITAGVDLIKSLVLGLNQSIPQITEGAIQIINTLVLGIIDLLPEITEGAIQIIVSLAQGISESLPELVPQIINLILFIIENLIQNIPLIIDAASKIITGLANGLIQALPLISEQLPQIIISIINGITESLPLLIESAGSIIVALVDGLIGALPVLIESLPTIVMTIVDGLVPLNAEIGTIMLNLLAEVSEILVQLPETIWDCIVGAIESLMEWGVQLREKAEIAMNDLCQKVAEILEKLPGDIWEFLLDIIEKVISWGTEIQNEARTAVNELSSSVESTLSELPEKISGAIKGAINKIGEWGEKMKSKAFDSMSSMKSTIFSTAAQIPDKVKEAITQAITNVVNWGADMVAKAKTAIENVASSIKDGLSSVPDDVLNIGNNIVEGLWQGIQNSVEWITKKVGEFACEILEGMKEALGIHSPSRVFRDEVGKYIAEGIGIGILENEDGPLNALEKLGDDMIGSAKRINGITLNRQLEHTFSGEINTRGDISDLVNLVSEYFPKLIEASQKSILLDGDVLVGQTINKIDEKLAANYMLKARGI